MANKKTQALSCRGPKPPNYAVVESSQLPPQERCRNWTCIGYRELRHQLRSGRACVFNIEPDRMMAFLKYVRARVGISINARIIVRKRQVWLYALPTARRVRLGEQSPTRSLLNAGYRARIRDDAEIRCVVADFGEWMADFAPGSLTWDGAISQFVLERGDAYALDFDAETLGRWIAQVEGGALISPYIESELCVLAKRGLPEGVTA